MTVRDARSTRGREGSAAMATETVVQRQRRQRQRLRRWSGHAERSWPEDGAALEVPSANRAGSETV
eukprot:1417065-Prymnesium_polylepis.1